MKRVEKIALGLATTCGYSLGLAMVIEGINLLLHPESIFAGQLGPEAMLLAMMIEYVPGMGLVGGGWAIAWGVSKVFLEMMDRKTKVEDEWNKHIKERVEEFRNKGMDSE